jgi:hypothetical protein
MLSASHGQGSKAIELGKRIIGENQIESAAIEFGLEVFPGFDARDRAGGAILFEQGADEFSVSGAILEM